MQYVYDVNASEDILYIKEDNFKYLFKVRRFKIGDTVQFRNLRNNILYHYEVENIGKKEATLLLVGQFEDIKPLVRELHLIWCVIDSKIIERTLPMLNQLGLSKITFVYCERSQKNFKIDLQRVEKILINSSQQCGRTMLMQIELLEDLEEVLAIYNDIAVLDFGGSTDYEGVHTVLIGCEGGFTHSEKEILQNNYKIGFKSDYVLKSETAAVSIVSKLLI